MKGKGYGLRMCRICHLSILIYYLTTIRLHNILIFLLLFFYGHSVHFQAMASPISSFHHASSLLALCTCTGMYQRHRRLFYKFSRLTHPASFSVGTRVSSAEVKRPRHEFGRSCPSTAELKSQWSLPSIPSRRGHTLPGTCFVTILMKTDN